MKLLFSLLLLLTFFCPSQAQLVSKPATPRDKLPLALVSYSSTGSTLFYTDDVNQPARVLIKVQGKILPPALHSNTNRVAFVTVGGDKNGLFIINTDGNNLKQIVKNAVGAGPAWSFDGKQLAFVAISEKRTLSPDKIYRAAHFSKSIQSLRTAVHALVS